MTIDEAIKALDRLTKGLHFPDIDLLQACEMGSMALTILIEEHDRISGMMRHYTELEEDDG